MTRRTSCPCTHTTPCDPRCACAKPSTSPGCRRCRRCCRYGGKDQQKIKAEWLAEKLELGQKLPDVLEPVVQEIEDKLPTPSMQNIDPNYHVEITLSVAECREILKVLGKLPGDHQ